MGLAGGTITRMNTKKIVVRTTPEKRQMVLRRMLTENPKVKVGLTEGQKRALAGRSTRSRLIG